MSNYAPGTPFKRRPAIIFNDYRQQLPETIEPLFGTKYPATWMWEISGDRDKVYSKVNDGVYGQQDQNSKLKTVEMGLIERNALFEMLRQAAVDKEFTSSQMSVFDKSFTGGDRLPLRATFTVMRGKTGEVRVHYRKSTYEATFIMASKRMVISKRTENNGWVPDAGLSSSYYILAYLKGLTKFLNDNEINNFKPKERKTDNDAAPSGQPTGSPAHNDTMDNDFGGLDF